MMRYPVAAEPGRSRKPLRALVSVLLIGLFATGCSPADFFAAVGRVTPSSMPGAFIGGGSRPGQIAEAPLELTGGIHALSPDPGLIHPAGTFFSSYSRTFVWIANSGDALMAAELGGQARELAPYNRSLSPWLRPSWTSDGTAVMMAQYATRPHGGDATGIPLRGFLVSLRDGTSTVLGDVAPDGIGEVLPDGSGISSNRPVDQAFMPPDVLNNVARNLYVQSPGQDTRLELAMGGPGFGTWTPDGKAYAYFEYPNHDPNQGMDLKLYDRRTSTSRTVYHLASNPFLYGPPDYQWDGARRLAFSTRQQPNMSELTIHLINVDDGQVQVRHDTLPLGEGEFAIGGQFSPDLTQFAYEVTGTVGYQKGGASGTYHEPRGLRIMSLADGTVRSVSPRGRLVSWLPGGKDLIAATGREDETRFYRIDVPSAASGAN